MELLMLLAWLAFQGFPFALSNQDAKRLYDDLLSNYNRLIRPVGNNSDRLTVKMGLRLSQLIDVVSSSLITITKPSALSNPNTPYQTYCLLKPATPTFSFVNTPK